MQEESSLWLKKADDDLRWCRTSIKGKIYYGACFLAQQVAEKSLKAYLISKKKPQRKIHDLGALLKECSLVDKSFLGIKESLLPLVDYYAPKLGTRILETQLALIRKRLKMRIKEQKKF